MAKKKVISVFGILLIFALALTVIGFSENGGISGKAVSSDLNSQELFIGNEYEFSFNLQSIKAEEGLLRIKGTLFELKGKEHNLQVTSYVMNGDMEIIGEYEDNIFIAANDRISVNFGVPYSNLEQADKISVYFDNGNTMTKGSYFVKRSAIVGSVVENVSSNGGSKILTSIFFILVAVFIFLGVLKSYGKHKKQMNFSDSMEKKHHRKFIDLDIR